LDPEVDLSGFEVEDDELAAEESDLDVPDDESEDPESPEVFAGDVDSPVGLSPLPEPLPPLRLSFT
jgi:hypothetical protein